MVRRGVLLVKLCLRFLSLPMHLYYRLVCRVKVVLFLSVGLCKIELGFTHSIATSTTFPSRTRALIDLIDKQLDRYFDRTNDRFVKTCILMGVVSNFHESGGRFLQRTSTGWQILDDDTSRKKAGNLFRYRQGLLQKQQQQSLSNITATSSDNTDQVLSYNSDVVHQNKRQRT